MKKSQNMAVWALAQQNGFGPAKPKTAREECNRYDVTGAPCIGLFAICNLPLIWSLSFSFIGGPEHRSKCSQKKLVSHQRPRKPFCTSPLSAF